MEEITVHDLMSDKPTCLSPTTTLGAVANVMANERHSCMVIGDNKHPMGIITERDLVKVLLQLNEDKQVLDQTAEAFMSSPVLTLNHNESLYDAIVVARTERIRHLPVVDDADELVGLVTQTDLANAHFHIIEMQSELIEKSVAYETADLRKLNDELQALSMEDHLTEIGNRRSMEVDLQHTHAAMQRYGRGYAVALLDVDFFKKYNDHYGHTTGDEALRIVAKYFKQSIRASDRLYRYGGEELLLLLPETNNSRALTSISRMIAGLAAEKIPHSQSPFGVLTMSAGVADALSAETVNESWEAVVELADQGLYKAKERGRNQTQSGS